MKLLLVRGNDGGRRPGLALVRRDVQLQLFEVLGARSGIEWDAKLAPVGEGGLHLSRGPTQEEPGQQEQRQKGQLPHGGCPGSGRRPANAFPGVSQSEPPCPKRGDDAAQRRPWNDHGRAARLWEPRRGRAVGGGGMAPPRTTQRVLRHQTRKMYPISKASVK